MDEDDIGGDAAQTMEQAPAQAPDLSKKLNEFRANNRTLHSENQQLKQQLAALSEKVSALGENDPSTIKSALQLLNTVQDQAEAELIKEGRFDEVVARRLKPREAEWEKQLREREKRLEATTASEQKAKQMASTMMLERQLRSAIAAKKLRANGAAAEEDLIMRLTRDWKMPDDLEGDPMPANPQNIAESLEAWVDAMVEKAPHLWEGGQGGGARPGSVNAKGQRVVKRSELTDREYGRLMPDIQAGKIKVIQ